MAGAVDRRAVQPVPTLPALRPSVARAKRGLDVVGAGLALVLLAPIVALAALAVRLESPGPVFVRRLRVGTQRRRPTSAARGGRRLHDAGGELFLLPRMRTYGSRKGLTLGGRILRATRLESWPQLWMVLAGHMSLVGSRPATPRQAIRLAEGVPHCPRTAFAPRRGTSAWDAHFVADPFVIQID